MLRQPHLKLLLVITAVALGVYYGRGNLNRPAPAFALPEVYGGQVSLDSYRNRPVLLVFWTTSCPICQRELPMLSRLEPDFRAKGVSILAVHVGGESEAADYLGANGINLTAAYDADGTMARAYDVGGVPKLVLIGDDGKIKRSHSGWTSESVLRGWVN